MCGGVPWFDEEMYGLEEDGELAVERVSTGADMAMTRCSRPTRTLWVVKDVDAK